MEIEKLIIFDGELSQTFQRLLRKILISRMLCYWAKKRWTAVLRSKYGVLGDVTLSVLIILAY